MDQNMNNNPTNGERTFTQEEVNRIVSDRLSKERAKGESSFAEREQQFAEREKQLANREALLDLKDQLKEMGLPAELLPVLNVQDREALNKALEAMKTYIDEKSKDKNGRVYMPNKLPNGELENGDSMESKLRKAMHLLK